MTLTTDRPAAATEAQGAQPASRAERRAAEKAAQQRRTKAADKQAKADRKAARKAPNAYQVGDHARYDTVYGGHRVSYTGGKITKVAGRQVVVEFAPGIDFLLDHRDTGLQKTQLV